MGVTDWVFVDGEGQSRSKVWSLLVVCSGQLGSLVVDCHCSAPVELNDGVSCGGHWWSLMVVRGSHLSPAVFYAGGQ